MHWNIKTVNRHLSSAVCELILVQALFVWLFDAKRFQLPHNIQKLSSDLFNTTHSITKTHTASSLPPYQGCGPVPSRSTLSLRNSAPLRTATRSGRTGLYFGTTPGLDRLFSCISRSVWESRVSSKSLFLVRGSALRSLTSSCSATMAALGPQMSSNPPHINTPKRLNGLART